MIEPKSRKEIVLGSFFRTKAFQLNPGRLRALFFEGSATHFYASLPALKLGQKSQTASAEQSGVT